MSISKIKGMTPFPLEIRMAARKKRTRSHDRLLCTLQIGRDLLLEGACHTNTPSALVFRYNWMAPFSNSVTSAGLAEIRWSDASCSG